ncbi:MAG TPA: N-acetylmuramic acid 6-phosphate etherase [Paenisporosarcina sp.]|nr:N-acetylmuramic acid 6-phosphate etherase [Paenisporosarcina sp.]
MKFRYNKKSRRKLFQQLRYLSTEQRNPRSSNIDTLSIPEILRVINAEDRVPASAVEREIPHITRAVKLIVEALRKGGRLIYIGAGTSGRLGILDAAECPPTYGTDPKTIQGLIAGGKKAVFRSQEGAEDNEKNGRKDIGKLDVCKKDVVCGIAASVRTPYVVSAIKEAKKRGAKTIYITTNRRRVLQQKLFSDIRKVLDVAICPNVGSEIIMGSTRMKSGTAQKMVLNMMTTATMICLGKVYENMMIDLKMNSRKLKERAKRVLMIATGVDYNTAEGVLKKANGHVKTAIVMVQAGVSVQEARHRLRKAGGFVRKAIQA